jgi:hypothetical protein
MSVALQPYGFTMKHQPAQLHETMALIAQDHAEMVNTLAIALAIESDRSLQLQLQRLARASDGQSFMVSQLRSRAWLKLGNDRGITVHRERVDGLKTIDLDLALGSNPDLTDALQHTLSGTTVATASELLDPVWEMDAMPSREQYAVLRQWSPLLEQMAYKSSARILNLLDALRPEIIQHLTAGAQGAEPGLSVYWSGVHIVAYLTLLASEPEAQPWLSDMASQFRWTMWTPTFPLLRERTVWLAACAARSAVAFGEPVIGQYLTTLSKAEHPMKAFDALFGLVAIALGRKVAAASILAEIRSLKEALGRRHVAHADYFRMAYDDAMRVISEAASGEHAAAAEIRNIDWRAEPQMALATRAALCTDPASFPASGRFVGFSILPIVVSAAPQEHYCATATLWRDLDVTGQDIVNVIRRAWVPNSQATASGTLH